MKSLILPARPATLEQTNSRTLYLSSCSVKDIVVRELQVRRQAKSLNQTSPKSSDIGTWDNSPINQTKKQQTNFPTDQPKKNTNPKQIDVKKMLVSQKTYHFKPRLDLRKTKLQSSPSLPIILEESARSFAPTPNHEDKKRCSWDFKKETEEDAPQDSFEQSKGPSKSFFAEKLKAYPEVKYCKQTGNFQTKINFKAPVAQTESLKSSVNKHYQFLRDSGYTQEEAEAHMKLIQKNQANFPGAYTRSGNREQSQFFSEKEKKVMELKEELAKKENQMETLVNLVFSLEKKLRSTSRIQTGEGMMKPHRIGGA